MTRIKWTKQDIDYLKANHSQYTSTELADFLGRQVNTVQTKLWQLQLKAKRSNKHNPTITGVPPIMAVPRPSKNQVIYDPVLLLRQGKEELKQILNIVDSVSGIKGAQAELLETIRALNAGKITPEHAMAALEIGAYLIESAGDSLESAASLTVPTTETVIKIKADKPSKKPHPWRELDKQPLPEPTGVFANVFAPKGGFVPPEIGSVTKVVDGVRK